MDIDKLILYLSTLYRLDGFGSLMDIDKLIPLPIRLRQRDSFGSLMDIDKLILGLCVSVLTIVLVL